MFLFELLDSNVWRKVAPYISHLKSLDFHFGLQMVFPLFSTYKITELPGGSGVEATVLGHEVTHHETFPRPVSLRLSEEHLFASEPSVERGTLVRKACFPWVTPCSDEDTPS